MAARTGERGAGTNQEAIRRHNLATLLRHVHRDGHLSRAQLTERMQLNRSTIADLVGELEALGAVRQTRPSPARPAVGRPSMDVHPDAGQIYVLAAAVMVDEITVAAVGLGGQVLGRACDSTPKSRKPADVTRTIARLVRRARSDVDPAATLVGVGAALPGTVSDRDGLVRSAPNLGWSEVPFATVLGRALDTRLHPRVGNDADLGALAEHTRGTSADIDDLVYLSGGAGVGGGVIAGGLPLRGAGGYAGEIGHLTVTPGGRPCRCGNRGCWETEVGAVAIAAALGRDVPIDELSARLRAVRRPSAALLRVGGRLGTGLAGVVNVFNPRRVILGGVLADLYPVVSTACDEAMHEAALSAADQQAEIALPALGRDSVLLGAAEQAFEALLADPAGVLTAARAARRSPRTPRRAPTLPRRSTPRAARAG